MPAHGSGWHWFWSGLRLPSAQSINRRNKPLSGDRSTVGPGAEKLMLVDDNLVPLLAATRHEQNLIRPVAIALVGERAGQIGYWHFSSHHAASLARICTSG